MFVYIYSRDRHILFLSLQSSRRLSGNLESLQHPLLRVFRKLVCIHTYISLVSIFFLCLFHLYAVADHGSDNLKHTQLAYVLSYCFIFFIFDFRLFELFN